MNLPEIKLNTIHSFFDKKETIFKTIEQITKDFRWIGIDFQIEIADENESDFYVKLHQKIILIVGDLTNNHFDKLKAFLFRADITELEIAKTEQEIPNYSLVEVLAHQIIVKALKKVLFRQYYSKNHT